MFVGQSGLPPVNGYPISRKEVFSATMYSKYIIQCAYMYSNRVSTR